MIQITADIALPESELLFEAMRAQGPGGQNVNKVASAVQLRFDVTNSSLPAPVRERLLATRDRRLTRDGVLVIKAQRHRSQERNRADALERLAGLLEAASARQAPRIATRPSRGARRRRVDAKTRRGQLKSLRKPVRPD